MNPLKFDGTFKTIARQYSRGDPFLAEDILSEMRISILVLPDDTNNAHAIHTAKYAAIDFVRSRLVNYSYGGKFQHVSWEAMIEAGFSFDTEGGFSMNTKNFSYKDASVPNMLVRTDLQCSDLLVWTRLYYARNFFTEREWKIMVWYHYYDCTQNEIAQFVGLGRSMVSKILRACRGRCR